MFHEVTIERPLEVIQEAFKKAVESVGFAILNHYHFSKALRERGYSIDGELFVYDICNPSYGQSVVSKCIKLGCLVPCRISIYYENGKGSLHVLSFASLLKSLKETDEKLANELGSIMMDVDEVMRKILERTKEYAEKG